MTVPKDPNARPVFYRHVPGGRGKVAPVRHYECGGPNCPACQLEEEQAERNER